MTTTARDMIAAANAKVGALAVGAGVAAPPGADPAASPAATSGTPAPAGATPAPPVTPAVPADSQFPPFPPALQPSLPARPAPAPVAAPVPPVQPAMPGVHGPAQAAPVAPAVPPPAQTPQGPQDYKALYEAQAEKEKQQAQAYAALTGKHSQAAEQIRQLQETLRLLGGGAPPGGNGHAAQPAGYPPRAAPFPQPLAGPQAPYAGPVTEPSSPASPGPAVLRSVRDDPNMKPLLDNLGEALDQKALDAVIQLIDTNARNAVAVSQAAMRAEFGPVVDGVVQDFRQNRADQARADNFRFAEQMFKLHPSWEVIRQTEDFANWLGRHPFAAEYAALAWPEPGQLGWSVAQADRILNEFKQAHPQYASATPQQAANQRVADAAQANVGQVVTAPGASLPQGKPPLLLRDFLRDAAAKANNPKALAALNAELNQAIAEGRVVDNRFASPGYSAGPPVA